MWSALGTRDFCRLRGFVDVKVEEGMLVEMDAIARAVHRGLSIHGITVLGVDTPCIPNPKNAPTELRSVDLRTVDLRNVYGVCEVKFSEKSSSFETTEFKAKALAAAEFGASLVRGGGALWLFPNGRRSPTAASAACPPWWN